MQEHFNQSNSQVLYHQSTILWLWLSWDVLQSYSSLMKMPDLDLATAKFQTNQEQAYAH